MLGHVPSRQGAPVERERLHAPAEIEDAKAFRGNMVADEIQLGTTNRHDAQRLQREIAAPWSGYESQSWHAVEDDLVRRRENQVLDVGKKEDEHRQELGLEKLERDRSRLLASAQTPSWRRPGLGDGDPERPRAPAKGGQRLVAARLLYEDGVYVHLLDARGEVTPGGDRIRVRS